MTSTATSLDTEIGRVIDRLTTARDAGLSWLVSRIGEDGEPVGASDINSYYRVPWALATSGRVLEAGAVMSWMEREALTKDGDLVPGAAQTPWTTANAPYPLAIMAIGAWHLERYDTANRIMDNLERFQDPETGGAYIEHPEYRSTGRQDLLSTAQVGMAALATGRREAAALAYDWVARLIADQPSLPDRLFVSTAAGRLVSDFPDEEAFGHVVDLQSPRQAFFNPGIGAAFMARYFMATGETHALEIGRSLLSLSENATDQQYDFADTVHVGKFAWGAATMLEADPADSHLRDVVMLADWFANCQRPDGRWYPSAFLFPAPNDADALWKTAEHIMIINFMLGSLPQSEGGVRGVRFGIAYATHPDVITSCVEADQLGYDAVHLYDSPLVFSEVFSVAGAVAALTENVKIGISVAVPHLRLPHVLAAGVGTLSAMAPGRIQLALGTGFTAALTTGSRSDTWAAVADAVGVCRGILRDELTEAPVKGGERRLVKHLHADHGFINTRDEVPIHISAAGPKGLRVTAEMADGFYTMSAGQRPVPAQVAETIDTLNEMAAEAGRSPLPVTLFTTMAIKDADEPSDSERLRGFVGPAVTQHFHGDLGFGVEDPRTPLPLREAARKFYEEVGSKITGPAAYVRQHRGHAMFLRDEEAHLLTPELIEAVCQIGTAGEILGEVSALEQSGVGEIVWQVMPGHEREVARFAAEVMEPYRRRSVDGNQ